MTILQCALISLAIFSATLARATESPTPFPPPHENVAAMARYIIHYSDWATVSHISQAENTTGYPQGRAFAMSDGTLSQDGSTGIPYFYTTLMEPGTNDLINVDPRSSVTASLAQSAYCKNKGIDVEDPRCAQVILTGNFTKIQEKSKEWKLAKIALFTRHPQMNTFPKNHKFFFTKLDIHVIQVVDYFGGSQYPSLADYFRSKPARLPATNFNYQVFNVAT